jgi:tetratricopeptide (TPR) repeat protein
MVFKRVFLIASAGASLAGSALADDWQNYKGDCDDVFRNAKTSPSPRLKECAGLWTAYVDPGGVKPPERQVLKDAFQSLYTRSTAKSDDEGQYLAQSAADRLGEKLATKAAAAEGAGDPTGDSRRTPGKASRPDDDEPTGRKKFVAPEVSSADKAKANKLVEAGIKQFRAKKRAKALDAYEQALEVDPGNTKALYNGAAEHAFAGREDESVEYLARLQDIGSTDALKALKATRKDADFDKIRDSDGYKRTTGFAHIKVVNSIGEFGEDEVERITKTLEKLDMKPEEVGEDKTRGRETPVIWYKPHSAATAYVVKQVVVHPGTIMTKITWDTPYDIIVSWGNKLIKKAGVKQPAKDYTDVDPEKQLDSLRNDQDKALRQPEQVARKVEYAVDTPNRIENKVEGSVKRVENTIDTIEKTGDKLDKIFK